MKKIILIVTLIISALIMNAQVKSTEPGQQKERSTPSNDTLSSPKSPSPSSVTSIKAADLPQTVTERLSKDYPGYVIKDASTVTGRNGLNYQVEVIKGTNTETLLYDKDGKFLRRVAKPEMKKNINK